MSAIIVPMEKFRTGRQLAQEASKLRDIGLRLVAAREAAKLSQAELCKMTGLPSSQISQWETGKHRPSLDAIVMLLPFLEVDLDYIYLGDMRAFGWEKMAALKNAWENALEAAQDREAAAEVEVTKSG